MSLFLLMFFQLMVKFLNNSKQSFTILLPRHFAWWFGEDVTLYNINISLEHTRSLQIFWIYIWHLLFCNWFKRIFFLALTQKSNLPMPFGHVHRQLSEAKFTVLLQYSIGSSPLKIFLEDTKRNTHSACWCRCELKSYYNSVKRDTSWWTITNVRRYCYLMIFLRLV